MRMIFLSLLLTISSTGMSWAAGCFDHSVWDKILKANVKDQGLVDYSGVRVNNGGNLLEYITYIELANLSKCGEDGKITFWINSYNANVVRMLVEGSLSESLAEDDPLFLKRFDALNKKLSLNEIRNRVIRMDPAKGGPITGISLATYDPRILFCLVDGTKGAPKPRKGAFEGKDVNAELDEAVKRFVNDPMFVRVENGQLILSNLFNLYKDDFTPLGGVAEFIAKYIDPAARADAAEVKEWLKSKYPDSTVYFNDRTLNQAPPQQ